MDRRFLGYYETELRFLRDLGGEFAASHPAIAGRLALDPNSCADPYVERLLEGVAFLAARVQLKLDAEFPRFTEHLLDVLFPDFLAPTPSMAIVRLTPDQTSGDLAAGYRVAAGTRLTSRLGPRMQTRCSFTTAHDVTLFPIEIAEAHYLTGNTLNAAGFGRGRGAKAAFTLRLATKPERPFRELDLDRLVLHLLAGGRHPWRLYEALVGHGVALLAREPGGSWSTLLDREPARRIGFADDEALLPQTLHGFEGYRLLQEYFAFPQRFLFFDLCGIGEALRRNGGNEVDIVILFNRPDNALLQAVDVSCMALHAVPAINLLDKRCDRIHVSTDSADFHVVPDRTKPMDYEVHSLTEVLGYGTGVNSEWRFLPFYNAFHTEDRNHAAYYSLQREPRLLSQHQQREGPRTSYIGTEVYLSVVDAHEAPFPAELRQLGVRALCTNRDLPVLMPVGAPKGDLTLTQTAPVKMIQVIKGPSRPISAMRESNLSWKLINQLSLNHLSLTDTDEEQGAAALRQILRLYAQTGDAGAQRQVDGVRSVVMKPVVRRLPMPGPITFGRGVELKVEVDDLSFEGASAFLLGCVLERFVARHVSINGFTQMRLHSVGRGDILVGRPRSGVRPIL